jgi:hypothetical protein
MIFNILTYSLLSPGFRKAMPKNKNMSPIKNKIHCDANIPKNNPVIAMINEVEFQSKKNIKIGSVGRIKTLITVVDLNLDSLPIAIGIDGLR